MFSPAPSSPRPPSPAVTADASGGHHQEGRLVVLVIGASRRRRPSLSIPSNPAHTHTRARNIGRRQRRWQLPPSLAGPGAISRPTFFLPPLNFVCPNPSRAHTTKKSIVVVRHSISSPWPHKHQSWWPKKGKAFVGNRLLSRGGELPPGCPVRVGDWGPFAGSESSKSRDRQRTSTSVRPGRPFSLP